MNWTLFLSHYNRSILDEELPLKILAVLEGRGLSTEEDLASQLKINKSVLNSRLLDLYKNECVHMARHTVRVSERGKEVLERFNLDEAIVEDLIDSLSINPFEKKVWQDVLMQYRSMAFDNYLNSIASIRVYRNLYALMSKHEQSGEGETQSELGTLTLLVRDLRNWAVHRDPLQEPSAKLYQYVLHPRGGHETAYLELMAPHADKVSLWLRCIDESDNKKLWEQLDHGEVSALQLLALLTDFQARSQTDDWYEKWRELSASLTEGFDNETDFLAALKANLEKSTTESEINSDVSHYYTPRGGYWWSEPQTRKFAADFLAKFMVASSISELAIMTNMTDVDSRLLVESIQNKCKVLLATRRASSPKADG